MLISELLFDFYNFLKEKKADGKKIIAYMAHDNMPEELIDAAGFYPLNLIFAGNDELMNSSHDYLPASTCSYAQSCIGLFSEKPSMFKFLDLIDYFIVSNHCVSNICASEMITKYFSVRRLNFYIPYTSNENAVKYYELELTDFKKQLEDIKGSEIKDEDLLKSINKYNNFKKKLNELNNLNIEGKIKLFNIQKAMLYGPDYINEMETFITQCKEQNLENSNNKKDLILTGCSIFIDDYLIELLEDGGGNILFFDTWLGDNYSSQILNDDILKSGINPLEIITHRFKNNFSGDHTVPFYIENKLIKLEKLIDNYRKKTGKSLGVINHIIKFCDHISINAHFIKDKFQERGIQFLNLERDYSRSNKGQLSTRIEAFLEMI